ncbi:cytochrome B [Fodinibius salsisoli]|uniref:Cytochrome B n=1 Tax=Fodinibius salsisoli TaxID=2820877 RepID=A0ABT3PS66_9BACT|nr:cytochrome B [Fodinibius salsisoli]MCW9708675.1 cytochrome B [Fodinibius salsisoli]
MYNILLHTHSGLRWLVLIALIVALFQTFSRRGTTGSIMETKSVLFTFILTHIQLLVGLILYFISPKVVFGANTMSDSLFRFFTVEHLVGMLIAIVLITLGYSKAKKAEKPFNKAFNYYIAAFILILLSIPWPFRELGAGWF